MNFRLLLISIALLATATACNREPGRLPPKTMQKVLLDMQLAEGFSTTVRDRQHKPGAKNYDSLSVYYATIFKHYNITRQQFDESMDWYRNHPSDLDSIYANMLLTVTALQAKVDKGAR